MKDYGILIIIMGVILFGVLIMTGHVYVLKWIWEDDCQKTSTQMLEIAGVKKDFLICTDNELPRIIKQY